MIDTGASVSCINDALSVELELIARDVMIIGTPLGRSQQPLYDLGIGLPSLSTNLFPIQALGSNLENQPYQALLGRDILQHCTFIYNGWDNSYQLHV